MRVIVGGRQSGKTTELIRIAHETDQYLVEPNRNMANYTFRMARGMGMPIRNPVTPDELLGTPLRDSAYGRLHPIGGVLVDEAQEVLERILRCGHIDAMSISASAPTDLVTVLGGGRNEE